MAERQLDFYRLTHPGNGSQWDDRLQKYIYNRPSEEYHTSLPPPISTRPQSPIPKKNKTIHKSLLSSELRAAKSASILSPKQTASPSCPILFSLHKSIEIEEGIRERRNVELEKLLEETLSFSLGLFLEL